jgi:hypothetical protein
VAPSLLSGDGAPARVVAQISLGLRFVTLIAAHVHRRWLMVAAFVFAGLFALGGGALARRCSHQRGYVTGARW